MIILNERNQVKRAFERLIKSYSPGGLFYESPSQESILQRLSELDPEKASVADITEITSSNSSIRPYKCSECGSETWDCVQLGEEPDIESETAWICKNCLKKALQLFGDE